MADDKSPKPPKLFDETSPMEITLEGPWARIERNKSSDERWPGQLHFTTTTGAAHSMDIEIGTRGLTRRDRVCDFPPLKLWFDKDASKGTEFRGLKSLKLVTHCKSSRKYEQFYVKEFLAYRIYNQVTDYSFRVRPLTISYQEAGSRRKPTVRFGFLIEDVDDVAERLGHEELEIVEVSAGELHPAETVNYALFQYLIANLDWAATVGPDGEYCCHNGKLIGAAPDARPVFAIPYDFDSSGLVDADYAAPPTRLGVRRVTDRLYRGFCVHNDELRPALERFRSHEQDMLGLIRDEPALDNRERNSAMQFVQSFFRSLESEQAVQKLLIDKCRD